MSEIRYPFGYATKASVTAGATMALTIANSETIATISQMSAAGTLNLTVAGDVPVGSNLTIIVSADGTNRALTPGTKMEGNAVTVTASKKLAISYKYDGTNFVHTGTVTLN
jgi:hypothetical protein